VLTVILGVALIPIARRDPATAALIAREGGVIENTQVVLAAASGVLGASRALAARSRGQTVSREIFMTVLVLALTWGELDLDLRLFGLRVIHTKFFVTPAVWLPYRLLAALALAAFYAAIAWYAWRHRAVLLGAAWRMPFQAWGQLLLAGFVLFGLVQALEDPIGQIPHVPRSYLEESVELIAYVYFLLAMIDLVRLTPEGGGKVREGQG
jgi:hypothetical protein